MKIRVYKHNSIKTSIDDDFQKVINYYNSLFVKQYINEPITFDITTTNLDIKDVPPKLFYTEQNNDVVMFLFEQGMFPVYAQSFQVTPKLAGCYISVNQLEDNIDYTWKVFAHELLHCLWYLIMAKNKVILPNLLDHSLPTDYFHNDDPYFIVGNFEQQLRVLKPYYGYKYFKPSEVVGLKPELVSLLDKMRGECGFPFIINSGFRTIEENNKLKDAVQDSAHTIGLAVDLKCLTSDKRFKIIESAIKNGIVRVGIGSTFVHVDIDGSKPQMMAWLY